jgi:hypothetical protein
MSKVDTQSRKIHRDETIIEQLTQEIALLKKPFIRHPHRQSHASNPSVRRCRRSAHAL